MKRELKYKGRVQDTSETNTFIEMVFDSLDQVVFIIDPSENRILLCNSAIERIFGYPRKEVLGRNPEFLHVDKQMYKKFAQDLIAVLEDEEIYHSEFQGRRKNGETIHCEHRVTSIRDDSLQRIAFVFVIQDISKRKKAEAALRESESRYRSLFETMRQGVVYHDAEANILYSNPSAERIPGLASEEIDSEGSIDPRKKFIHENGSEFSKETHPSRIALKTGKTISDVVMGVFEPEANAYRWLVINAVPQFKEGENKPFQVHTVFTDITEIKRAEKELQKYSERLKIMHDIDRAILSARSPKENAQVALSQIRKLVPCQVATVVTFNLEAGEAKLLVKDPDCSRRLSPGANIELEVFGDMTSLKRGTVNRADDLQALSPFSKTVQTLWANGVRSYINVPLISRGKLIGALNLGADIPHAFNDQEVEIAREVADSLAVAMQNANLLEQNIQHQKQLQNLSANIIEAQEAERKRISMELHDEMGQSLTAISINLAAIVKEFSGDIPPAVKEKILDANSIIDNTLEQLRELALYLRPSMVDDLGLVPALRGFLDNYTKRTNIKGEFKAVGFDLRLEEPMEMAIYRVVQEALTNVMKHAAAKTVRVSLEQNKQSVYVFIEDDGKGFNTDEALSYGAPRGGIGLLGMRERVTFLGGTFEVRSRRGHGTRISVEIPLPGRNGS